MAVREAEGKNAVPSVVTVDSQSIKTSEAGGPKSYDAGKKAKGCKRHIIVNILVLPIMCQVSTADIQDRDALADLLNAPIAKSPWVKHVFVDGGMRVTEPSVPPMRPAGSD